MKVEMFKEPGPKPEPEKIIKINSETCPGGIQFFVCDDDGHKKMQGNLFNLTNRGTLKVYGNLGRDLGIQLDSDRYIQIELD
jgi:hypothetical protein